MYLNHSLCHGNCNETEFFSGNLVSGCLNSLKIFSAIDNDSSFPAWQALLWTFSPLHTTMLAIK